jgi:hypothetical protein
MRRATYFALRKLPADLKAVIRRRRDAEWTLALGITGKVLTPKECAKWLEQDRIQRARNVADARMRCTPPNW